MSLKKISYLVLFLLFFFFSFQRCLAAFDYVLPYPGLMPGHKLYPIKQVIDRLYQYWAFGNFSRFRYELGFSDKKLVEAKTLFEYQQYLLALKALSSSNEHFQKTIIYLNRAGDEGKNISEKMMVLKNSAQKHREVLMKLEGELPEEFIWQAEKAKPVQLYLKSALEEAIKICEI